MMTNVLEWSMSMDVWRASCPCSLVSRSSPVEAHHHRGADPVEPPTPDPLAAVEAARALTRAPAARMLDLPRTQGRVERAAPTLARAEAVVAAVTPAQGPAAVLDPQTPAQGPAAVLDPQTPALVESERRTPGAPAAAAAPWS